MYRNRSPIGFLATAWALAIINAGTAEAQIGGPVFSDRVRLDLDLAKPFYDGDGIGAGTAILQMTAFVPAGSAGFFVDLGVSRATAEGAGSNTALSNPRIGFVARDDGGSQVELALTVPLARILQGDDDFAVGTAFFADLERPETFIPDLASASAQFRKSWTGDRGATWGIRLGGLVTLPVGDEGDGPEFWARYGGFTRIPLDQAALGLELSGIGRLSDEGSIAERTLHFLTASLGLPSTRLRPELYLRLPVDSDLGDVLDAVVGLRVSL